MFSNDFWRFVLHCFSFFFFGKGVLIDLDVKIRNYTFVKKKNLSIKMIYICNNGNIYGEKGKLRKFI